MSTRALEHELRAAATAYEAAHRGPRRLLRGRPGSPLAGGVDGFVRAVCADPVQHVELALRLAWSDAQRHPYAAAPWAALVASLGTAGRRATEAGLSVQRRTAAGSPWCAARSRADARAFITSLGGATRGPTAAEESARSDLTALFTSAPSGWVREAALERLAEHGAVHALPFVVARLADPVAAVRAAAREATDACLSPLRARALLGALPELQRARRRRHFEDEPRARQYEALLRSQAHTGLFLERLDDPDREVRRAAYTLALETEGPAVVGGVIRRGIDSGDPVLLDGALAALGRLDDDAAGQEERQALATYALSHRSRVVRRRALLVWSAGGAACALSDGLVDSSFQKRNARAVDRPPGSREGDGQPVRGARRRPPGGDDGQAASWAGDELGG